MILIIIIGLFACAFAGYQCGRLEIVSRLDKWYQRNKQKPLQYEKFKKITDIKG